MGGGGKRWYEYLSKADTYIMNKFNRNIYSKDILYVDVDELMAALNCSRITAYSCLIAVAKRREKDGWILRKVKNKLYLFASDEDYKDFISRLNNNIMTTNTSIIAVLKQVTCPKCGYVWITKSRRIYVTCPSCKTSVKTEQNAVELNYAVQLKSENSAAKSKFSANKRAAGTAADKNKKNI